MNQGTVLRLRDLPHGAIFRTSRHNRYVKTRWNDDGVPSTLCVDLDNYPGNLESLPSSTPVERLDSLLGVQSV